MAALLPHVGRAILLDELVDWDKAGLTATVTIRPGLPFHTDRGVPAHIGIEYMAQACGAFSGAEALQANTAPRIGFILGTRRYTAEQPWFATGTKLRIAVKLVFRDTELGMFDCRISAGAALLASAQLVLAQPQDARALLAKQAGERDG